MLLKNVIGLSPDKSKHQFYLDIQPVSIFTIFESFSKVYILDNFYNPVQLAIFINKYYVFQKLGNGLGAAGRVQINVHLEELGSVADKNVKDPNEGNMKAHWLLRFWANHLDF